MCRTHNPKLKSTTYLPGPPLASLGQASNVVWEVRAWLALRRPGVGIPDPNIPTFLFNTITFLLVSTLLHACSFCSQPGTPYHMVWACKKTPSLSYNPCPTYGQWAGQLANTNLSVQRSLAERAASADKGFLGWGRPPLGEHLTVSAWSSLQ